MEMTKREYAEKIAEMVGGEVIEATKANGVKKLGIIRKGEGNVSPTVYVDEFYRDNAEVEFAAERIDEILKANDMDDINVSDITEWENAKPMLRMRLYNQKTDSDIRESAEQYGFDDLVMIPFLELTCEPWSGRASIKVNDGLIAQWGVTKQDVIDTAKANSEGNFTIIPMSAFIKEMILKQAEERGEPAPDYETLNLMVNNSSPEMYIVTNKEKQFGAYAIITAREQLKKSFPNGYIVLPSSIHEVLVLELNNETDESELSSMVGSINLEVVDAEEVLGERAYIIKEVA